MSRARPRARTRKSAAADVEATDVEPRGAVAGLPVARIPDTIDWGEELPTLVQSQSAKAAAAAAAAGPRVPRAYIFEEESDGRTTAVKRPSAVAASMIGHGLPRITHSIADGDSEEMPTLPLDARLRDLLAPHGGRVARGDLPTRPDGGAASPRPALAEPPSEETRPREERAVEPARASELTMEVLAVEVERLGREAKRLGDEARDAAGAAARAEAVSRMATEAAVMANDALRLAATAGLASAVPRLEQALALEDAARRGDVRIVSVAVPDPRAAVASRPHASEAPPSSTPPPPLAAIPGPLPLVGAGAHPNALGPPPAPPPPTYASQTSPPVAFDPRPRWPATSSHDGAIPAAAYETAQRRPPEAMSAADRAKFGTQDALAFEARLKPMLWGMPLPLALAFAAGIAALGLLVLWLLVT